MESKNTGGSAREPASRIAARAIARAAASSAREASAAAGGGRGEPGKAPRSVVRKTRRKATPRRGSAAASTDRSPWHGLAWQLHLALGAMQEDEYLILSIRGTNLYVQFAAQGLIGMRAEATSNYYLSDDASLGERQHRDLLELGWRAPTNLPEGIGPHETEGSPNYFVELEPPVDHGFLAVLAVATLVSVFGAVDERQLEYQAFDEDGTSIRFPALGVPMAQAC